MAVSQLAYLGVGVSHDATWQVQRQDRGVPWGDKVQIQPAPTAAGVAVGR